jgi:hypothetical protein
MNIGKTVLTQLVNYIPKYQFDKIVEKYKGNYKAQEFSCWEQYICMVFAQLTYRESLRDIETCLATFKNKLYHTGIRSKVSKSTLAYWNEKKDWHIYSEFASFLISKARVLYISDNEFIESLNGTAYAFDSTTIDVCLSLFPWAKFRRRRGAVKAHTLLDLQGNIPSWLFITEGSLHDVNALDGLPIESGAYYVMDKGYLHWKRLYKFEMEQAYWITRAKDNFSYIRQYSNPIDKILGLKFDQVGILKDKFSFKNYPGKIRRIKYLDPVTKIEYVFITNNLKLQAIEICKLYKSRWQIELFFKWIKQHLRIKVFLGTSRNAVFSQIWIAFSVYLLIAIMKKEFNSPYSLYTLLQKLSLCLFEKIQLNQLFTKIDNDEDLKNPLKQLNLFD